MAAFLVAVFLAAGFLVIFFVFLAPDLAFVGEGDGEGDGDGVATTAATASAFFGVAAFLGALLVVAFLAAGFFGD